MKILLPKGCDTRLYIDRLDFKILVGPEHGYDSLSIIPTSRSSEHKELQSCSPGKFDTGADISVAKLPPSDQLIVAELRNIKSQADIGASLSSFSSRIFPFLESLSVDPHEIEILGLTIRHEEQSTTTKNDSIGLHIGMHIDSWDGKGFHSRRTRRNRVSINCGTENRYLLFFPFLISETIDENVFAQSREKTRHVIAEVVRASGENSILRLAIPPMHFYIAPTENIIHDGQYLSRTTEDVTFVSLGSFTPAGYLDELRCFELSQ